MSIAQSIIDTFPNIDQVPEESAAILYQEFMTEWHEQCAIHRFEDNSALVFEDNTVYIHIYEEDYFDE